MAKKILYKSQENKVFSGILGGLGDYFNIDPVILRIMTILIGLITGVFPFIFIYIIFSFIVPKESGKEKVKGPGVFGKWWFWLFIFLFMSMPFFIILLAGVFFVRNEMIFEKVVSEFSEVEFVENRGEIEKYLDNFLIEPSFGGVIFSDYHKIGSAGRNIFAWSYVSEYYQEDGEVKQGTAVSLPVLLISSHLGDIVDHKVPENGSLHKESVQDIFPERYLSQILEFNVLNKEIIKKMSATTKKKAEDYFSFFNSEI